MNKGVSALLTMATLIVTGPCFANEAHGTARSQPQLKREMGIVIIPVKPIQHELTEQFFQSVEQADYQHALKLANLMVEQQPDQPTGYQLRSTVEYALGMEDQANKDAQWAGSDSNQIDEAVKPASAKTAHTPKRAAKVAIH